MNIQLSEDCHDSDNLRPVSESLPPAPDFLPSPTDHLTSPRRPDLPEDYEFRNKVLIANAFQKGEPGFRVSVLPDGPSLFFPSIEEALRQVIYGLGLENRDIMVFDNIPGVLPSENEDVKDRQSRKTQQDVRDYWNGWKLGDEPKGSA